VTTTPREDEASPGDRKTGLALATFFGPVVAVVIGWLLAQVVSEPDNPRNSEPAPGVTTQAPTVQGALPIQIDPVSGPVPRCATFAGDGDIPEGQKLWIVVQTNEAGQTKYYFNGTYPAAGRWSAPNVVAGSVDTPAGVLFAVLAVTFSDATSADISTGRYQDGVSELFPDASTHYEMTVERGPDGAPC
jgi:hypothetical protein